MKMPAHGFQVLYADEPAARAQWLAMWKGWPEREVMAHPAYVELFARPADRSACAVLDHGAATVLFPFVLRPLSVEPWAAGERTFDFTSPYGYGGAFVWGATTEALTVRFWDSFNAWASMTGVVSGFVRLSLFPKQILPPQGRVKTRSLNIVRDLSSGDSECWREYAHKVRKNVNRARVSGVQVHVDSDGSQLDEFVAIYDETMERRHASQFYRFDRSFFERLASGLDSNVVWFFARHGAETLSAELVVVSACHTYSFLGGTRSAGYALRPNDILRHEIIGWSRHQGKAAYVLGGGYGADDGILAHKRAFAPHGVRPFSVACQVFNAGALEELCSRRAQWELSTAGARWTSNPDWFPPYRG